MSRIARTFERCRASGRRALIPFVTAGDPLPQATDAVMHALVENGADLIELGVPFSDPMADGPVIQHASERAIEAGIDLRHVLDAVRSFRAQDDETPVVLMGYLNPIERFGHAAFAEAAAAAGVDGVLIVDCPPEGRDDLTEALGSRGVDIIGMLAPTSDDGRIERVVTGAGGFVYFVSFKGITGAASLDADALAEPLAAIRRHTTLPVAVGFGIKDAEGARAVARFADAVVIGSALVERIADADGADEAAARIAEFLAPVRAAMDNGARSSDAEVSG